MASIYLMQLVIGRSLSIIPNIDIRWVVYCHPLYRIGDFIIGGILASIYINRRMDTQSSSLQGTLLEIAAFVFNIATCASFYNVGKNHMWFAYTCLFTLSSILLVYIMAENAGAVSKVLQNKLIFWLASISAYGFLIHRVVISYYCTFMETFLPGLASNYFSMIIFPFLLTIAASYLYQAAEKGIRNMKRI